MRLAAGSVITQRLQARGQPQHHHPQIAAEGQQHLAHVLGLQLRIVDQLSIALRFPGKALDAHQLGGLHRQAGKALAKRLRDHFQRMIEMFPRIHQVAGRLHGLRAADGPQNGGHRIGMSHHALAGIQRLVRDQWLRKTARACQGICGFRQRAGRRRQHLRQGPLCGRLTKGRRRDLHRGNLHGQTRTQGFRRNEATTSICSCAMSVGACPTPSISTSRALGPRLVMASAVCRDSRSDSAPRSSSVSQDTAS